MLDKNRFDYLNFNQREAIRAILIQYIKIYLTSPIKYGVGKNSDIVLDILNGYLKKAVKPKWFDSTNQQLISDCYDYISDIKDKIDEFDIKQKHKLLFPEDIISEEQRDEIQKLLLNPVLKNKKSYKGVRFDEIDPGYIHRNCYEKTKKSLEGYIENFSI